MIVAEGIPTLRELFDFRDGFAGIPGYSYTAYAMTVAFALAVLFLVLGSRKQAIVPGRLQLAAEGLHGFIKNSIADEVIGHGSERYVPFLMTLFVTIFAFNFMEVMPGVSFPPTSKIGVPLVFAGLAWLVFMFEGMRTQGFVPYWKGILFPPGIPWPIYILLTPIELISTVVIRPITLTFRLTFNLLAGHLIISLLAVLAISTYAASPKIIALPFVVLLGAVMVGFEIFVGFLQAFIFTILTALYIGGAVHPEH